MMSTCAFLLLLVLSGIDISATLKSESYRPNMFKSGSAVRFEKGGNYHRSINLGVLSEESSSLRRTKRQRKPVNGLYDKILLHDSSQDETILDHFTESWDVLQNGIQSLNATIDKTNSNFTILQKNITNFIQTGNTLAEIGEKGFENSDEIEDFETKMKLFLKKASINLQNLQIDERDLYENVEIIEEEMNSVNNVLSKQQAYQKAKEEAVDSMRVFERRKLQRYNASESSNKNRRPAAFMDLIEEYLQSTSGRDIKDLDTQMDALIDTMEPIDDPELVQADRLIGDAMHYKHGIGHDFGINAVYDPTDILVNGDEIDSKTGDHNNQNDLSKYYAVNNANINNVHGDEEYPYSNDEIITQAEQESKKGQIANTGSEGVIASNLFDSISNNLLDEKDRKRDLILSKKEDGKINKKSNHRRSKRSSGVNSEDQANEQLEYRPVGDFLDQIEKEPPPPSQGVRNIPPRIRVGKKDTPISQRGVMNQLVDTYYRERAPSKIDMILEDFVPDRQDNDLKRTLTRLEHVRKTINNRANAVFDDKPPSTRLSNLLRSTNSKFNDVSSMVKQEIREQEMEQLERTQNIAKGIRDALENRMIRQLEMLNMRVKDLREAANYRRKIRPYKRKVQKVINRSLQKHERKKDKYLTKRFKWEIRHTDSGRKRRLNYLKKELKALRKELKRTIATGGDIEGKRLKILLIQKQLEDILTEKEGLADPGPFLNYLRYDNPNYDPFPPYKTSEKYDYDDDELDVLNRPRVNLKAPKQRNNDNYNLIY